jgi:sec-independent protein translocase protein TatC
MADSAKKSDPLNITMSLGDHLEELRSRLILSIAGLVAAFILCIFFGRYIIAFIEKPYVKIMGENARLQCLAPADGFVVYMQIAMVAAIVISSPWIFYQMWLFVSAGLYPNERRYIYLAVPFSAGLFIAGALLFVFEIAPVTLGFLVLFNKEFLGVESNFTFQNYISFMGIMMLVFGLAFQTPIAIFFLNKIGIVSIDMLRRSRRYVILGIVIVAAAVIPGSDAISLFALAVPMYLLFELGIFLSYLSNRKSHRNITAGD